MGEPLGRRRTQKPSITAAPPADLVAAPGYGARRMYQAYLSAWSRHVDAVLTGPQFAVLSAIRAYPDSDQSSLAGAVALDTSTMADVCRRMERRGLITRTESPRDARRKILSLTDDGDEALEEATRRTRRLDRELLAAVPEERRTEIAGLLNTLGAHWEAVAERDPLDDWA
ncbi:MarR family winged helix-turn-helix transcriptional regulator [Pseudonocardia parietis]|uniref:DNA-binding MarR family transcriptional regulator n=1 Tax=Pseudonocardia parietis TaxID=570936 RepID=A0ABS4W361_9PSEU|nr:MarR family winged helix-turn-helix transcriptional regulator [Pseudonocardia parietis]MBP2370600.1 DNA-binding MarR family transcriptional regulator [Pseudonocardia parietis]